MILACPFPGLQFVGTRVALLRGHWHFSRLSLVPTLAAPGWQAFLCQYFFSRQFLLFVNFSRLTRLPCWLLPSWLISCLSPLRLSARSDSLFGLWVPPFPYHSIWQGHGSDNLPKINIVLSIYPYQSVWLTPITASRISCWLGLNLCALLLVLPFCIRRAFGQTPFREQMGSPSAYLYNNNWDLAEQWGTCYQTAKGTGVASNTFYTSSKTWNLTQNFVRSQHRDFKRGTLC